MHTHMGQIHGQALTDIGLRRAVNEDAVLSARSIFAVADGMGGHEAGDLASRLCIETLGELADAGHDGAPDGLPHARQVLDQVEKADAMIRRAIGSRGGTTLCALAVVRAEPGGGIWPQDTAGATSTLELPAQADAAAATDHGLGRPRYLEATHEAHTQAGSAGNPHHAGSQPGPAGEPEPRTDVLPYVPAPSMRTPAGTQLETPDPHGAEPHGAEPHGAGDSNAEQHGPEHAEAADADPEPTVWLMVVNVGDSRGYRLREGKLTQLTLDHSAVQELIEAGSITEAEARIHPQRNLITRALGAGGNSAPDAQFHELVPGDRYLLCSDGLTGEVDPEGIESILRQHPERSEALTRLVEAALASGGRDNISVVIVDVLAPEPPA